MFVLKYHVFRSYYNTYKKNYLALISNQKKLSGFNIIKQKLSGFHMNTKKISDSQ